MSSKAATPKKRKISISEGKTSGNPKKSAVSGGQDDEAPAPSGRSSSQQEKPKAKNRRVDPAPSSGPSSTTSTVRQNMPHSSGSAGGDVASPRRKLKLKLKQQQHKTKQQQQQHQQKHQKQQQKQRRPTGRRPKVLLHELAAQVSLSLNNRCSADSPSLARTPVMKCSEDNVHQKRRELGPCSAPLPTSTPYRILVFTTVTS